MYLEFYGLKEMPFRLTPDLKYIFQTDSHLEAVSTITYGVEQNKGLVVVTGEAGTGKTTTLRAAILQFGEGVLPIYIFNPFLTSSELYEQIARELQLKLSRPASKAELMMTLGRVLGMRHAKGLRTVLIVDEAQGLPAPLIEEIRLLLNFETNSEKLLQIILCGQPELQEALNQHHMRQIKQRVSLRCSLKPLGPFEISKYIRFRLETAGAEDINIFDHEAISLISRVSQGVPRVINNVCDNALLHGYAAGRKTVTREIIEDVVEALDLYSSNLRTNPSSGFGL
jgi:general secretion pathway protein A